MRAFLALAFGLSMLGGCPAKPSPKQKETPPGPIDPAKLAEALGVDAATFAVPVDPAPPSGDLQSDLEHFTTLDACIAERSALDPVVGDALLSIGYDTFLRDACRVLEATKLADARRCSPIEASSLRMHCESYVAMVAKDPERCPYEIAGEPRRGRAATCVAVASRDRRLCAAESPEKRPACEAMLGIAAACTGLRDRERSLCQREAARWKTSLGEIAGPGEKKTVRPEGTLRVSGSEEGSSERKEQTGDLAYEVSRGIVIVTEAGKKRLRIGTVRELGAVPRVSAPVGSPRLGLELALTGDGPADVRIEHVELEVPGSLTLVSPPMPSTLKAHLTKFDPTRGGEVRLRLEGTLGGNPGGLRVEADIVTFVRDFAH